MKPILKSTISAFDALNPYDVVFDYDGNLPYKNRLLIINVDTLATIYNATITSTSFLHTIPAQTLMNGLTYTAQIQTFDKNNVASELSSKSTLYCLSEPTFSFDQITQNYILTTPTLSPTIYYSQLQNEPLKEFYIKLYDSDNKEIYSSGVLYNISSIEDIKGLTNETIYYLEAKGTTLHGMSLDTGKIKITTKFTGMTIPLALKAENMSSIGQIKLTSNIIIVHAETAKPVDYIDNIEADLRDNYIIYTDCFIVDRNFSTKLILRDSNENTCVLEFTDDDGNTIELWYHTDKDYANSKDRAFFRVYVTNDNDQTYMVSTAIADKPSDIDSVKVMVTKVNNYYDVKMEIGGTVY